jgi:hypothetical protein
MTVTQAGPDEFGLYYQEHRDELGRLHREDGPALRVWRVDRKGREHTVREIWANHGDYHRKDGPAIVHYSEDTGRVWLEEWYYAGQRHRDGGPAIVQYDGGGRPIKEKYYVHGEEL